MWLASWLSDTYNELGNNCILFSLSLAEVAEGKSLLPTLNRHVILDIFAGGRQGSSSIVLSFLVVLIYFFKNMPFAHLLLLGGQTKQFKAFLRKKSNFFSLCSEQYFLATL